MQKTPPFISVIVPTYERLGPLSRCLSALAAQEYPRDRFEVLVVDDGSVGSIHEVVESFRHRLDVVLLTQSHAGPATARNHGAAHAKGSYLAFTDDDCAPALDWLRNFAFSFSLFPESVLGGRTVNELGDNRYSTASQMLSEYLHTCWNSTTTGATFFASNNLAMPTTCFKAVRGFDAGWDRAAGEDRDLCDRLLEEGYRLVSVPNAVVRHAHVLTARGFVRQHFNYGWGAYHLHRSRAQRSRAYLRVEPVSFYLNMMAYPFTQTQAGQAASIAVLLGFAQAATAVGWISAGLSSWRKRGSESRQFLTRL